MPQPSLFDVVPFRAHPMLRGGHLQTLAGTYLPSLDVPYRAERREIILPDGDILVLHDDRPESWTPECGTAVLVHGLCGSYLSPYLVRIAAKLNARGVRAIRMDLRGCGAGVGLAKNPYHAGISSDLATVIESLIRTEPNSAIAISGFSLGANITLKYLAEGGNSLPEQVRGGVVVNPPIDLSRCIRSLVGPLQVRYDRYFTRLLLQQVAASPEGLPKEMKRRKPKGLYEFDDRYTAPVSGFKTAENYYKLCSTKPILGEIRRSTLLLMSADDPLIPHDVYENLQTSGELLVHMSKSGGHLGYLAAGGNGDKDARWMDWRVVEGVCTLLKAGVKRPVFA